MHDRPSEKLEHFLRSTDVATPFVVIDLDVVATKYLALSSALPQTRLYYAVKANPAAPILDRLVELGSAFDVASPSEIDAVLAAGASPSSISYGNTVKKRRDIAYAASCGIARFTIDAREELDKIVDAARSASVCVRLQHDGGGADWPLSRKFGCNESDAVELLCDAGRAGMATGVAFHVGSQQRHAQAWDESLERAAIVCRAVADQGAPPSFLNLGGGFPARYIEPLQPIAAYAGAIGQAVTKHFGDSLTELMIEPGRYLVADAGVLRTEVVLVSRRSDLDHPRWVYLDCGRFGGLAETMDEAIRYRLRTVHDGSLTGPVAIAGPTCDSTDVLYEKSGYELPLALTEGDFVDFLAAGAYTTTYASVGFNGFAPLAEYFV